MKSTKSTPKTLNTRKGSDTFQQFFIWHGEKIVVGIIGVVALWFALQGLGFQTLSWRSDVLIDASSVAEKSIRESTRSAADEGINVFDYETHAEQIKKPVAPEPYRIIAAWLPPFSGTSQPPPSQEQE